MLIGEAFRLVISAVFMPSMFCPDPEALDPSLCRVAAYFAPCPQPPLLTHVNLSMIHIQLSLSVASGGLCYRRVKSMHFSFSVVLYVAAAMRIFVCICFEASKAILDNPYDNSHKLRGFYTPTVGIHDTEEEVQ